MQSALTLVVLRKYQRFWLKGFATTTKQKLFFGSKFLLELISYSESLLF